jgi:AcrR family transcriptional regulator
MARTPAPGTRDRILKVAARLFQQHGVRAVGLQQVIDETGLGKNLLYREFPSKDDLVTAWLREDRAASWSAMLTITAPFDGDPARQLLAVIEMGAGVAADPGFRGCIFHNTSNEFRDPDHPANREAVDQLRQLHRYLESLARTAGADDPQALADALMLVLEGMYASSAVLGPDGPSRAGVTMARILIERYCPSAILTA